MCCRERICPSSYMAITGAHKRPWYLQAMECLLATEKDDLAPYSLTSQYFHNSIREKSKLPEWRWGLRCVWVCEYVVCLCCAITGACRALCQGVNGGGILGNFYSSWFFLRRHMCYFTTEKKWMNKVVFIWKKGRERRKRKTVSLWGWLPASGWLLFRSASWIHIPELTDLTRMSSVSLCHDKTIFFSHYFKDRVFLSRLNMHFDRSSCTPPSLLSSVLAVTKCHYLFPLSNLHQLTSTHWSLLPSGTQPLCPAPL